MQLIELILRRKESKNSVFEPTVSQINARKIMGKNFFGVEEAIKYFGIKPTDRQLAALSEIPFSDAILKELKDTHILVAVFPLSIWKIREMNIGLFYKGYDQPSWYKKLPFYEEYEEMGWRLVCKTAADLLCDFGEFDTIPTPKVMIYAIIAHYLTTKEKLFEHTWVETSMISTIYYPDGEPVYIGYFGLDGLNINRISGIMGKIGVGKIRKEGKKI